MQELFESNQSKTLINFIGKFPDGRKYICDCVPDGFEGGLLYKTLSKITNETNVFIPIIGSCRKEPLSFKLYHPESKLFLDYTSEGSFAGYGHHLKDFYEESLEALSYCDESEFNSRVSRLDFLLDEFEKAISKNPFEIPTNKEKERIQEWIDIYNEGEDARMIC